MIGKDRGVAVEGEAVILDPQGQLVWFIPAQAILGIYAQPKGEKGEENNDRDPIR
jgi:hypothetical protein